MARPRVFMDFSIDNSPIGRVIFELFNDAVPKTTENFRALCTGEKGLSPLSDRPLYYKNSIVHRSIADFMIQGGGEPPRYFTKRNGTGGESIYGGPYADEDLTHPLDSEGLLCMANRGPNTNGSQFFITLRPCPHLNGKHVVFGRVIRGFDDVVRKIAQVDTDEKDRPAVPVIIYNCGELELRKKAAPTRSFYSLAWKVDMF
ncbi:cyclophilin-like domain-containing protein [Lactifluus volemus]|nr:cyclophilin-like domain-containing protein [Lactifluus volemus]